jgi:hypothetical protein
MLFLKYQIIFLYNQQQNVKELNGALYMVLLVYLGIYVKAKISIIIMGLFIKLQNLQNHMEFQYMLI